MKTHFGHMHETACGRGYYYDRKTRRNAEIVNGKYIAIRVTTTIGYVDCQDCLSTFKGVMR